MTDPPAPKKRKLAPSTAWTALGCGCAAPAVIGILLIFALLTLQQAREKRDPTLSRAALTTCTSNLHQIYRALGSYARDYPGKRPAALRDLVPLYLDAKHLTCPLALTGGSYDYAPAATGQATLVTCPRHGQGRVVLQADGRIRVERSPRSPVPGP